jgi:hypothetical protein
MLYNPHVSTIITNNTWIISEGIIHYILYLYIIILTIIVHVPVKLFEHHIDDHNPNI